jgi:dTDP-4-amino-4,6-dideoxygalactose transaminase
MPIPLLDVNAQNHPLADELEDAFKRVLQSGQFIMGPDVPAFENECAPHTGVPYNLGVSSGTDAILLALMALGIGPGDEVLVPAFTFFATAGCVTRLGATPVFGDVCPICFNLDPVHAATLITAKTKAIIPVHLFGQMADMDAIMALAAQHNLYVIEDAAQAFGATYKGKPAGSIGHFGCYSFFPSKNLGALGDAGLLSTRDPALAERARILRVHGMEPKYFHQEVGANFRLDTLQAAFLRVKLQHYPAYTAARQANAARYTAALSQHPRVLTADPRDCKCLLQQDVRHASEISNFKSQIPSLILPVAYPHNGHIWNQYTLRIPGEGRRDALKVHLQSNRIGCEIYYPLTLDQQPCYQKLSARAELPVAHRLAREVLSLPVYPELNPAQLEEIIRSICEHTPV